MKKKLIFVFISILISIQLCLGQNTNDDDDFEKITPPSPTAYAMAKYGQLPISLFTGTPNIDVPIFQYKCGGLTLPISLNYSSSGIKVDDLGSYVGLGWSPIVGGVLSRIIRDSPDEESENFFPQEDIKYDVTDPVSLMYFQNEGSSSTWDSEPDLFLFNFNGHSGKFFLDCDKNIRLIPNQLLRVEVQFGSIDPYFIFTTPDGTKYFFEATEYSTYTKQLEGKAKQENPPKITSWYLTKIVSVTGDEIYLEYERGDYYFQSSTSQTHTKSTNNGNCPGGSSCDQKDEIRTYKNYSRVHGQKLKRIRSNAEVNGSIEFFYETHHPEIFEYSLLSKIEISNNDKLVERLTFEYISTAKNRVFLTDIKMLDLNKKYHFDYFSPQELCERLSYSQDYWGNYNGKNNYYLVPCGQGSYFESSTRCADREPDPAFSITGMLSRIIYPTGGESTFFYEGNMYWGAKVTNPDIKLEELDLITESDQYGIYSTEFITPEIPFTQYAHFFPTENFCADLCDETQNTGHNKAWIKVECIDDQTLPVIDRKIADNWIPSTNPQEVLPQQLFEYRVFLIEGKRYKITVSVNKPCQEAHLDFHYYEQDLIVDEMNLETGGLRIRQINDYDSKTNLTNKTFYYYDDENGHSTADPGNKGMFLSKRTQRITCGIPCDFVECGYIILGTDSQLPLTNTGNSTTNYKLVTKSYGGPNFENGGEKHEYIINRDLPGNPVNENSYSLNSSCFSNNGWDNGLEKRVTTFANTDGQIDTLRVLTNFYLADDRGSKSIRSYNVFENYEIVCTKPVFYTCTAKDVTYKLDGYDCVAEHYLFGKNIGHSLWIPSGKCMRIDADNRFVNLYYHPCFGLEPGTQIILIDAIDNLNIIEYENNSIWHYLDSTNIKEYNLDGSLKSLVGNKYLYDNPNHLQNSRIRTYDSKGNTREEVSYFVDDFNSINNYPQLSEKFIKSNPVKKDLSVNNFLVESTIFDYNDNGRPIVVSNFESEDAVDYPPHDPEVITSYPNYYFPNLSFSYDEMQSRRIERTNPDGTTISYQYSYQNTLLISKTINSKFSESAHTSFENNESNGWTLYGENSILKAGDEAHTGEYVVKTNSTAGPFKTFMVGQEAEKHPGYTACVWVKGGAGAFIHIEVDGNWSTHVRKNNVDDPQHWNLIEVEIPKSKYESLIGPDLEFKVYIGGDANALWDDIRFHPTDASMTTYTYAPLIGMTSQSDANNLPTYYEYDDFGRLKLIRDHKKNILKTLEYNYAH